MIYVPLLKGSWSFLEFKSTGASSSGWGDGGLKDQN